MASIFEKTPFFKVKRTWDEKTKLPETYKLRSNEYGQKQTAEIHTDGGQFGPEFTISRTIADFIRGAAKVNLGYEQSLLELENVFQGPLLTDWKYVVETNFPEPVEPEEVRPEHDRSSAANFNRAIDEFIKRHLKEKKPRDRQYIYMAPGGDYSIHKDLLTTPMDHLHRFQEMLRIAELMPAGDIPPPNAALQVEWFYMTFHKSDRSEYVRSGRLLEEETIVSLAEYFERLYNAHLLYNAHISSTAHYRRSVTNRSGEAQKASCTMIWRSATSANSAILSVAERALLPIVLGIVASATTSTIAIVATTAIIARRTRTPVEANARRPPKALLKRPVTFTGQRANIRTRSVASTRRIGRRATTTTKTT